MNLNLRIDAWEIGKSLPVSGNDFPELLVSNGKNGFLRFACFAQQG
jgi:hypothetical protein